MNVKGGTGAVISRDDVEKALWQVTGWQGDQAAIDGVMVVIEAWNASATEALTRSSDSFRNGYYHALVTMASAILETGGKMRLVPPGAEPVLRAGDVDELAAAIVARLRPNTAAVEAAERIREFYGGPAPLPDGVVPAEKTCTGCGRSKPLETGFYKDAKGKFGRKARCKECEKGREAA